MRAKTNSSHRPAASSAARAWAGSFFEQIEFTIPRRLRVRTTSTRDRSRSTGPSLSVPSHSVSSRSQTTSFTGRIGVPDAGPSESIPSGRPSITMSVPDPAAPVP